MKKQQQVRHYVKHNYHDHSQDPLPSGEEFWEKVCDSSMDDECSIGTLPATKIQGGACIATAKFPLKLHALLDNAEVSGVADVI